MNLKIQINQETIEKAIAAYLPTVGVNTDDCTVTATFTRSRQAGGFSADVEVSKKQPTSVNVLENRE